MSKTLLTKNGKTLSIGFCERPYGSPANSNLEVDGCEVSLGEAETALGVVTSGFFSALGRKRVVVGPVFGYAYVQQPMVPDAQESNFPYAEGAVPSGFLAGPSPSFSPRSHGEHGGCRQIGVSENGIENTLECG